MIPGDDRGLLLGDGLFETLLAVDGALQDVEAHLDRLERGCAVLGIEPPARADALAALQGALEGAGLMTGSAVARLTLTAGSGRGLDRPAGARPRLFAMAAQLSSPRGPVRLATVDIRRNETSPASRLKTLSYLDNVLARVQARAACADEALMLNTKGELACAAAANLFWIAGERLFTPALDCGVLDGIMRGRLIAAARSMGVETAEAAEGPDALETAEAVLITSSLIGAVPVGSLDGRGFAASPLAEALSSRCR
jgi:branched-chain amino acid aminotransferase/4-amino-4-deoxychorismate lyase